MTTIVTSRGPTAAALTRRSAEVELEIERLQHEQRSIATRLRELAPPKRSIWMPALAGALVSALLAAPVIAWMLHDRPAPPVAAAPKVAPVEVPTVVVTPVAELPRPVVEPVVAPPPPPLPAPSSVLAAGLMPATREGTAAGKGALTVVCLPKCDQILDNGRSIGPGHIFGMPMAAGRHVLTLASGPMKKSVTIEITADRTTDVRVSMSPDEIPGLRD